MDIFEKLNKTFSDWYESWFGDEFGDIRPKDVLRKIINEMERNRKEGLDSRIYVPNKYILEISFKNDEERNYLLAFLDKEELDSALQKYMDQNKYYLRGPFDFTIDETVPDETQEKHDKLTVKSGWDIRPTDHQSEVSLQIPGLAMEEDKTDILDDEEYTVADNGIYDDGTISPPSLLIKKADGRSTVYIIQKPSITIGRSHRYANDVIIDDDGMVSKQHAKISASADGYYITDLGSTNGIWVNNERTTKSNLRGGDVIRIGSTEITFDNPEVGQKYISEIKKNTHPPKLTNISDTKSKDEYLLASEMTIGRSLSCDIHINDSSVSRKHAQIYRSGVKYYVKDLKSRNGTKINNKPAYPDIPVELQNGDIIRIGEVEFNFEMDRPD